MLTMDIHFWLDFRKTLKQQSNIHHENTTDWKAEETAELWWVCCFSAAEEFVLILYFLLNVPLMKMFLTFLSGWSEVCATYIMSKGSSQHHVWRWAPESVEPLTCVRSATKTEVLCVLDHQPAHPILRSSQSAQYDTALCLLCYIMTSCSHSGEMRSGDDQTNSIFPSDVLTKIRRFYQI